MGLDFEARKRTAERIDKDRKRREMIAVAEGVEDALLIDHGMEVSQSQDEMRRAGSQTDTRPTMFKDTKNVSVTGSRESRTWFQRSLIVFSFLHKDLGNQNYHDTSKLTGVKTCKSSWKFIY